MKKKIITLTLILVGFAFAKAQTFTSFFTGDTTDVTPETDFGICLMGGATESDPAMVWFLEKANGGDILVLRASGSDGYNDYFFSELGVTVNSVETLVITDSAGATDPYVLQQIGNAEAIWFAGGDQWNYVNFFKDNFVEQLLNEHVNIKGAPIGGTSAGMAILGDHYFSAQNGTVTSAEALANPYDEKVAIGNQDFIQLPFLENTITDTHFDSPDRRGRSTAFLARIATDMQVRSFGIASEEFTAVCIDEDGKAYVYGEHPEFDDFAYFMQANCTDDFVPENCTEGNPLEWDREGEAVKVYKVPGTINGSNYFDLSDWTTGVGGTWEHWTSINGVLQTNSGESPDCSSLGVNDVNVLQSSVYPNPFMDEVHIDNLEKTPFSIFDTKGAIHSRGILNIQETINTTTFSKGIYFLQLGEGVNTKTVKLIKK